MLKPQKIELLSKIKDQLSGIQLAIIADYRGLNVEQITDLRRKLSAESAKLTVVKNTFMKRITPDLGWEGIDPLLKGPTAVAYAEGDDVTAVKVLYDFAKKHKKLELKGGMLEGQVLSAEDVSKLASLPSKEQLISQLLSVMQGPMRNLVSVLQAPMRDLVGTLQAVADKKSEPDSAV